MRRCHCFPNNDDPRQGSNGCGCVASKKKPEALNLQALERMSLKFLRQNFPRWEWEETRDLLNDFVGKRGDEEVFIRLVQDYSDDSDYVPASWRVYGAGGGEKFGWWAKNQGK